MRATSRRATRRYRRSWDCNAPKASARRHGPPANLLCVLCASAPLRWVVRFVISPWHLRVACHVLRHGGVVAYPTEAVYGLGCDPQSSEAVEKLLRLKRRPLAKGLILVAGSLAQLTPYIAPLTDEIAARVVPTWPGPFTWLLPAAATTAPWLRGEHATIAVRISDHPIVSALCNAFGGALVSTSANIAGRPPARDALAVRRVFGTGVDYILHGPLGGLERPTSIRDACTGRVLR